jgi:hypothetical protein
VAIGKLAVKNSSLKHGRKWRFLQNVCFWWQMTSSRNLINIEGILLETCSTCVCCPGQSINICFLSDTVRQRSSSNFSMWGILLKLLVFYLNFLIYTGCANEMWLGENMCFSF